MVALTVPWRILDFLIATNWFLCTDAVNDDTKIVFFPFEILSRNLFVMPVCVRNEHHLSQLPYGLVSVAL